MHILNIGTPLSSTKYHEVRNIDFLSGVTLLDADLIFWDVNTSHKQFPGSSGSVNTTSNQSTIDSLKANISKRKNELNEYFKIGRTLIITSPIFHKYNYTFQNSDAKEHLDFIDCLDITKPKYEYVTGQNIQALNRDFIDSYYLLNKKFFKYHIKITKSNGLPIMFIKDTKYVVSEYYRINNGLLIVLPQIKFINAINDSLPFLNSTEEFINELKTFNEPKPHEIPDWVEEYVLSGELAEKKTLESHQEKLIKIKSSIQISENNLSNFKFLKALFSSNGDTLENAVKFVMEEFGFEIEESEKNRDDLIIKEKNKIAVVEIKGLTKSAAEKNAAQLQKWVSNYHVENDFNPKGILIVNTYKNHKLEDRIDDDFPNQMLPYSKQMNHCLITGVQLLCLYLDFKSNKIKKRELLDLLFNTVGELKYCKNPSELISKQ